MKVVKDFSGRASQSSITSIIPVVNLAVAPVVSTPVIGSIVFDIATGTVVPYDGTKWDVDKSIANEDTLYITHISNSSGLSSFEHYLVNTSGNSVHVNARDRSGSFTTTGLPATFRFNVPHQTTQTQESCGVAMYSTAAGTATGDVAVTARTYSTGTASQAGTVITGVGTAFTSTMVGGTLTFLDGTTANIIGFASATVLTVSSTEPQTVSSQTYSIAYTSGDVYLAGPSLAAAPGQLTVDLTYFVAL